MSIINALTNLVESFFKFWYGLLEGILSLFGHTVQSFFDLFRGAIKFLLDNFMILGFLLAAFVGYSIFLQNKQGVRGGVKGQKKVA